MAPSDYVRSLGREEKAAYFEKLKQLGFIKEEDDPFIEEEPKSKGHLKKWSTSIDSWPTVEFGDIYVYLIDCPGYTPKSLKAYKSLDAYNAFVNGWVHQLNIRQSHTGHCIIRASVNRTQNFSDGRHNAWVGFKIEDGSIISGHCTCMNGSASICVHVVAIMFQVEAAPRLSDTGKICTVCHCTKEEVLEPQENDSPIGNEEAPVIEFKSDVSQPQEEFAFDISTLPETSDNAENNETNYGEAASKDVTYIQCEGVEPGMIIIVSTDGQEDQTVITPQLNEVYACQSCNLNFATRLLLENHMETHNEPMEIKIIQGAETFPNVSEQGAETVSNVGEQEISTEPDKRKEASPAKSTRSRKGKFQCNVCDSTFTTSLRLENHKKKQHAGKDVGVGAESKDADVKVIENMQTEEAAEGNDNKVYPCTRCGIAFSTSLLLESHIEEEHKAEIGVKSEVDSEGEGKHSHLCKPRNISEYESDSTPKEHSRPHSGEFYQFQCDDCGKMFSQSQAGSYRRHMRIHTAAKSFVCNMCGKAFSLSKYLKRHMASHEEEKPFKCKECDKAFSDGANWKRHMRTHTGEKPHTCDVCGQTFTRSTNLHVHRRIHSGKRPYTCKVCGRAFYQSQGLKSHMGTHLPRPRRDRPDLAFNFKCKVCERTFSRRGNFKVHLKMHAKKMKSSGAIADETGLFDLERPFLCKLCGESFVSSHYRDAHQKVHTGETRFKCAKCDKGFIDKTRLLFHERTHTGEKPFECGVCGRRFSLRSNLSRHMKIHSGERSYECNVCSKAFKQVSGLTQHLRSHTGEKPYKCDLCEQAFSENRGLKNHKQRIHNVAH